MTDKACRETLKNVGTFFLFFVQKKLEFVQKQNGFSA